MFQQPGTSQAIQSRDTLRTKRKLDMVIITSTYKYRIYPTKQQESVLNNQFSMCRHLYNWSLAERIEAYEEGAPINYYDQAGNLKILKADRPWFKGVHSQVLQNVLKRLDNAYQKFFKGSGFPKFRKKGQWDSITYPQYDKHPAQHIKVPKIGNIKLVLHRKLPDDARVKTLSIVKDGGKWFACFSFQRNIEIELKHSNPRFGAIDMGLIDFVYTSDGNNIPLPKFYHSRQIRLKRLQRRFAKAKKQSAQWYKLLKAIQKTHYRIKCARMDFLHKTANWLLEKYDTIFIEDLKIANMIRRPKPNPGENGEFLPNGAAAKGGLNKSIANAGWHTFRTILQYKAFRLGKEVIAVPPHFTSQKCSGCGEVVKKSLSVRTHVCHNCELVLNRDHNAAINVLGLGLQSLESTLIEANAL